METKRTHNWEKFRDKMGISEKVQFTLQFIKAAPYECTHMHRVTIKSP